MPNAMLSKEIRALCHDHHVEMRLTEAFSNGEGEFLAYACTAPDCLIHYDISRGYFMASQNGSRHEQDEMPKVKCFLDSTPMYLAEIDLERRDFRLWRCPQCGARLTNEENLVGLPPKSIQDFSRKSGAQP